jgi:hypothetical protein
VADAIADVFAGNDLTVGGSLDATLDGRSGGFVDFDLGLGYADGSYRELVKRREKFVQQWPQTW